MFDLQFTISNKKSTATAEDPRPDINHYRNLLSLSAATNGDIKSRPTLNELQVNGANCVAKYSLAITFCLSFCLSFCFQN